MRKTRFDSLGVGLLVVAFILTGWMAPVCSQESATAEQTSEATPETKDWQALNWFKSLEPALEAAKAQNKPVFIDFTAVWCGWCRRLESITYSDPAVWETLNTRFVLAHIDGDENPDLVERYGVSGFPCLVITDSNGETLLKNSGFVPPDAFDAVMVRPLVYLPLAKKLDHADTLADPKAYAAAAEALGATLEGEVNALNLLAWNWLTEDQKFPHSALVAARKATAQLNDEVSEEDRYSLLDTLATAELLTGNLDDAVRNFRTLKEKEFQGADENFILALAARGSDEDKAELVTLLRERLKEKF